MAALFRKITGSSLYPVLLRKRGSKFKALLALSLVSFFWGTTWLASRQGVKFMPPLQMAGIRQFLGGSAYVAFFMTKGRVWPKGREWRAILVLSLLNFVLSNGLATWGVKYISGGLASIIGAIFPVWLVILGIYKSQKLPFAAIIGIILGFAGICIIFYEHLDDFLNPEFSLGILLSVAATWAWTFGTLYTKKQARDFNPYFSLGLQMMLAGSILYGISFASGQSVSLTAIPWQSWAAIGYLVLFGSVIAFVAYLYALQQLPTEFVSIYAYINPVVAVLIGAMLFGEKLTGFIAVGGAVTLYGVYLVNQAFRVPAIKKKSDGTQPAS